eukprot:9467823-Pyramimonas_sp.AAC.1
MLRMLDECAAAVLEGGAGAMVSADVTGGTADTPRAAVEASFADARAAGGVEAGPRSVLLDPPRSLGGAPLGV